MLQILQDVAKLQKFQLDNLEDFKKCCKTRFHLEISVPIQPKTSENLPKSCQKLATTQPDSQDDLEAEVPRWRGAEDVGPGAGEAASELYDQALEPLFLLTCF